MRSTWQSVSDEFRSSRLGRRLSANSLRTRARPRLGAVGAWPRQPAPGSDRDGVLGRPCHRRYRTAPGVLTITGRTDARAFRPLHRDDCVAGLIPTLPRAGGSGAHHRIATARLLDQVGIPYELVSSEKVTS